MDTSRIRCVLVLDTRHHTYDYLELCHFFKLLSVSACPCCVLCPCVFVLHRLNVLSNTNVKTILNWDLNLNFYVGV